MFNNDPDNPRGSGRPPDLDLRNLIMMDLIICMVSARRGSGSQTLDNNGPDNVQGFPELRKTVNGPLKDSNNHATLVLAYQGGGPPPSQSRSQTLHNNGLDNPKGLGTRPISISKS